MGFIPQNASYSPHKSSTDIGKGKKRNNKQFRMNSTLAVQVGQAVTCVLVAFLLLLVFIYFFFLL